MPRRKQKSGITIRFEYDLDVDGPFDITVIKTVLERFGAREFEAFYWDNLDSAVCPKKGNHEWELHPNDQDIIVCKHCKAMIPFISEPQITTKNIAPLRKL